MYQIRRSSSYGLKEYFRKFMKWEKNSESFSENSVKLRRTMSDLIRKDLNESLVEEIEALEAILSEEDELDLNLISGSNDLQITTRITPLTGQ